MSAIAVQPVVVTGGAGFIGCNLADRLASDGHHVLVFDALARPGVEDNLDWLRQRHPRLVSTEIADVCDRAAVRQAMARTQAVFHLAAQVAVTTSLDDPDADFEINLRGTFNVIDALRRLPSPAPLIFASTNKVYGDLADLALQDTGEAYLPADPAIRAHGIGEDRPLQFYTPYGCSKGGADQYVLDAARSFGVPTAVIRMSCVYGPHQMGTEDQGWLAHFMISVLRDRAITLYGDGRQVRDALHVDDAVAAYLGAWRRIGDVSGQAFNLGGGPDNAVTLRQVIAEIERLTGKRADVSFADWRPGDQRYFVADSRRIGQALNLPKPVAWRDGLALLADWMAERHAPSQAPRAVANA